MKPWGTGWRTMTPRASRVGCLPARTLGWAWTKRRRQPPTWRLRQPRRPLSVQTCRSKVPEEAKNESTSFNERLFIKILRFRKLKFLENFHVPHDSHVLLVFVLVVFLLISVVEQRISAAISSSNLHELL